MTEDYDEFDALEDIAKLLEDIRRAAADAESLAKEVLGDLVEVEDDEDDEEDA